jgi:YspA, cpYpsA-related SLOG family
MTTVPPRPYSPVVIAGTRSFHDYAVLERAINESGWLIGEVVSGCANGVDQLGERWAAQHGIPVRKFPAQWRHPTTGEFDKAAGFRRNSQMAHYASGLIALWDGKSPGTKHMIQQIRNYYGKPAFVWRTDR